jgi:hypothetical protein
VAAEHGFPYWTAVATRFQAATAAREGRRAEAAALLEDGADAHRAGTAALLPWWPALLAPVLDAALAERLLAEQLSRIETTDVRWCEAELRRARGEAAGHRGDPGLAEASLTEALAIARRQKARHWELRAAVSLARLWSEGGERQKALDLLAPVYGWFEKGLDTADLKEAKALLDDLS